MRSGLNVWLTHCGYAGHDHVRYTDEQATQLHHLEQEQQRQARRTEVNQNANRIIADDYIPAEPLRNAHARLGFGNASPGATDHHAREDPEQAESDHQRKIGSQQRFKRNGRGKGRCLHKPAH